MREAYQGKSVLYPGQQLHLYARRGTSVVTLRGDVLLDTPPICIGEGMFRHTVALQEGQSYLLADSGWIIVRAQTKVELACVSESNKTGSLPRRLLLALLSAWRRFAFGLQPDS